MLLIINNFYFSAKGLVMAKHPDLSGIEKMMLAGENFSLTSRQYQESTGSPIPKEKYYVEHKSAVAQRAHSFGFHVELIPAVLRFVKD